MSLRTFTAYIEYDPYTKLYIGIVPSLPGAHIQGTTLDELRVNLEEVIALCLEEKAARQEPVEDDTFVGTQRIIVNA